MSRKSEALYVILQFILIYQVVPKKAIRFINDHYDYTGRAVKDGIEKKYIESQDGHGERNLLRITKRGVEYLKGIDTESFPEYLTQGLKKQATDYKWRTRQIRLSWIVAMLQNVVPEFNGQYLELEKEYIRNTLKNVSPEMNGKIMSEVNLDFTDQKFQPAADKIRAEIQKRFQQNESGNWCMLVREMRMLDTEYLKKLSLIRAIGVLHLPTGDYALYNSMSKQLEVAHDYEMKFSIYMRSILKCQELKLIVFAKSYRVALRSIQNPIGVRTRYLLGSNLYKYQFYVPLVAGGAKQLEIYKIPGFRDIVRKGLIPRADRERAQNLIYDGMTEEKDIIFIGFECELSEIQEIYDKFYSIRQTSKIIVHCFAWQARFYRLLFGNRGIIQVSDADSIINNVLQRQNKSE